MRNDDTERPIGISVFKGILVMWLLSANGIHAYSAAVPPETSQRSIDSEPKIIVAAQKPEFSIRDEVKDLRWKKRKMMPYLDKGYVKESIQKESVKERRVFKEKEDKKLVDIVNRAFEVDPAAKAYKEKIIVAKRRLVVALRELLPGGEFNFEFRNGSLSADSFSGRNYHVKFKVPVFRGGILWNSYLREKSEYKVAQKEYVAAVNQLADEVSSAYFEFIRSRGVYDDRKELTEIGKKHQGISKQKFDQGLISEIEYLNVESMAGQIQYDMETAKQELELAKLQLERFLEVDNVDEVEIAPLYDIEKLIESQDPGNAQAVEAVKPEPQIGKSLDELVDLAYQNRPELQVEAHQLRSARLDEKIKQGAFMPRVDLTMEFGEQAEAFIRNADDPPFFPEWQLGFEVSGNVAGNRMKYTFDNDENAPSVTQFLLGSGSQTTRKGMTVGFLDGLGDYAEVKDAKAKKLEQIAELEKKEQEVIKEVKEAYYDYQKAKIQVESSLKRSQYRRKLVQLSMARLEKTEIEISEYLQSEVDQVEERGKLHRALADLFKAKSKLNKSIGIRDYLPLEERYGI